ncbi:hypothetical protein [unidentified bacterial endosymbiont]|uniref:hypothetical protein n=1 Tax=unidentified bacterial endosymbiont TaxID=2355 RepID=UPI00209E4A18|nr:hypothetical protein [unidentified bacterial endosymbiont]
MGSYRIIIPSNFDSVSATSAIDLAAQLAEQTPEHTLMLMDKGFLHHWQSGGVKKHGLILHKKNAQYQVIQKPGKGRMKSLS